MGRRARDLNIARHLSQHVLERASMCDAGLVLDDIVCERLVYDIGASIKNAFVFTEFCMFFQEKELENKVSVDLNKQ